MEHTAKDIAAQLCKPEGELGLRIGEFMHKGNADSYKYLLEIFPSELHLNILEIGMGSGAHIPSLITRFKPKLYLGLDYSETMINEAKKQTTQYNNVSYVYCDASKMKVPNSSIDVLFTINTVYFYKSTKDVFNEIYRVLIQNGTVIIGKRTKQDLDVLSDITDHGFNKLSGAQVVAMLKDAGFRNVSIKVFKDSVKELPDGKKVTLHSEFITGVK